jgi:DNA mismatch endonuclease, patch repair protein
MIGLAMDTFTPAERSAVMKRVASKDTGPEMAVRSMVHGMGFRYALHRRDLPGNPDLVFPARGRVIFVHGCFWHGHSCRAGRNRPSSNTGYWIAKLDRNQARDAANRRRLRNLGWRTLVVWECELKNPQRLRARLARFFG